jgi:hypothetical protein
LPLVPFDGGAWPLPCETPAVPESVAVGVGLSGVWLTVGDGDCDGLDVWTGDVEALGDVDGEADVVGDGDCAGDCVRVPVGVGDVRGHAVGEAVA